MESRPSDNNDTTLECNRLQLRFLEEDFRRRFAQLVLPGDALECDMTWEFEPNHGGNVSLCFKDHKTKTEEHANVVVRPFLGDDYSSVLREMKGIKERFRQAKETEAGKREARSGTEWFVEVTTILFVGRITSVVATEDQLKAIFGILADQV